MHPFGFTGIAVNGGVRNLSKIVLVGVAQLAEHWVVAPAVEGSNPFTHPIRKAGKSRS
jgi:hypothetical protein